MTHILSILEMLWCSIMKRIMFALFTQARNKLIRWDMCQLNPEVGPF